MKKKKTETHKNELKIINIDEQTSKFYITVTFILWNINK